MKKLLLLLFFLNTGQLFAQNSFSVELSLGYAYQNELIATQPNLYNDDAIGLRAGANFSRSLTRLIYLETGLFGKYNRGQKSMELVNFTSHNFRIQIPVMLGINPIAKWRFSAGLGLENNRDFDDFNLFSKHKNIRYDLLTKFIYSYTSHINFSVYTNWSLSRSPDIYSVSSPENGVYLGLIYRLR
ncbi:MAG: hypothetical protein RLN81_15730 [Balneolaceae bacterium]